MAPKAPKAAKGSRSGANDGRKGSKAAGIGAVVEGGAMATAVLQRKAVGSLSGGVEAQVRTLLRELHRQELAAQQAHQHQHQHRGHETHHAQQQPPAAAAVDGRVLSAFSGLWDALAAVGFGPEHVKRVFMELPRTSHPSLEAALDWLCLHLPAVELPSRFKSLGAAGAAGAAPVRILSVAAAGSAAAGAGGSTSGAKRPEAADGKADRPWDADSDDEGGGGEEADGEQETETDEAEAGEAGAAGGGGGPAAGAGGTAMKEWILRYMDEQASSGGEEDGQDKPASSASSLADFEWDLWGDPREVARRRAERGRQRLPPDQARQALAEEWSKTKEVAARAKTAGDKARQKDAGLMLRDLKQEMAAMKVTEQQLEAILSGAPLPAAAPAGAGASASGKAAGSKAAAPAAAAAKAAAGKPAAAAAAADPGKDKDKHKHKDKEKEKEKGKEKDKDKEKSKDKKDKKKDKDKDKGDKGDKDKDKDKDKEKSKKEKRREEKREKHRREKQKQEATSSDEEDSDEEAPAAAPGAAAATAAAAPPPPRRPPPPPEPEEIPESWEEHEVEMEEQEGAGPAQPPEAQAQAAQQQQQAAGAEGRPGSGEGEGEGEGEEEEDMDTSESDAPQQGRARAGAGADREGSEDPMELGSEAEPRQGARQGAATADEDEEEEEAEGGAPVSDVLADDATSAQGAPEAAGAAAAKPKAKDEDEPFMLPGLFDEDPNAADAGNAAAAPAPSALLRAAAAAADAGAGGKKAGGGKKAAGGKPAGAPVPEPPKTPRALLSQLCMKMAWSPPRYERLPLAEGGGGFRYNVVLDLGPARGVAKKRNLHGVRVYAIPAVEQPEGPPLHRSWPEPPSAQDAAAARALYEVAPPLQLQQSTFQAMAPEWRQLWLDWEATDGATAAAVAAGVAGAAAAAAGSAAAAAKAAEDEKLSMLRELLSQPPAPPSAPPVWSAPAAPVFVGAAAAQRAAAAEAAVAAALARDGATAATAPAAVAVAAPSSPAEAPAVAPAAAPAATPAAVEEGGDAEDPEAVAEAEVAAAAARERGATSAAAAGNGEPGAADGEEDDEEERREEEDEEHAEPMSHHDGDAVEQEEWEDMVAMGRQQQGQDVEEEAAAALEAAEAAEAAQREQAAAAATAAREAEMAATNAALRKAMERWQASPAGRAMQEARAGLPIAAVRGEVLAALRDGDVVVVSGDTGCGKTTQVPQYLLEDAIASGAGASTHVVVTQPRRIAAISVAERVADERGEPAPGSPGPASTTGYHVRLGAAVTRHTRLTFCTTGILLRRLAGDPSLRGVTHVVVDEVHERSLQSDFLIALLRDLLAARRVEREAAAAAGGGAGGPPPPPQLKVVLMSATLDAKLFAGYFSGCPVLHAAGRTFPVSRLFLEDVYEVTGYRLASDAPAALRRRGPSTAHQYTQSVVGGNRAARDLVSRGFGDDEALAAPLNPDYDAEAYSTDVPVFVRRNLARVDEHRIDYDLLEALLGHIDASSEPGAVLVFLPGIGEINMLYDRLTAQRAFSNKGPAGGARCVVLPLHSAVPPAGQRAALRPPPAGLRKVVLATNIAETSLTIEDVVAVVDTGRHKERRFNPSRAMSMLVEDWVSAASAQQRAGRAGRVRPGVCYATFTKKRFEGGGMRRYGAPEITRVPLEELVLQILLMGLGPVSEFLARVLEPPQPRAVTAALDVLKQVGALEPPAPVASASTSAATAAQQQPGQPQLPQPQAPAQPQAQSPGQVAMPLTTASIASAAAAAAARREVLSPLGRHLALLPVAPRLGKLLVVGALLGCLAPAVTIAAAMSHKSPFLTPTEERGEAERARRALAAPGAGGIAAGQQSDHLLLVAAYERWRIAGNSRYGGSVRAAAACAKKHFLHGQTLEQLAEMRCQLAAMLADARLVQPAGARTGGGGGDEFGGGGGGGHGKAALAAAGQWLDDPMAPWNKHARDPVIVKAALTAALSPAVAVMCEDSSPTGPPRWADAAPGAGAGEEVFVHPSSVVHGLATPQLEQPYLVYLEKMKTSRLYLRDVTATSPLSLLLFGPEPLTVLHAEGAVVVGGSGAGTGTGGVRVACRAQTAVLVKQLRRALNKLLEQRFRGAGGGGGGAGGEGAWRGGALGDAVIAAVRQMLREEDDQRSMAAKLT